MKRAGAAAFGLLPIVAILWLWGCSGREARGSLARETQVKILLVGLDAADWQIAGPLADAGRMPHLARLRARGAWGSARSLVPVLSPLLWTSIATGVTADRHGVIDFLTPDPGTGVKTPIRSTARRVPALWDHFTAWSRTSDIVAWWATWPAEPILGHMVSDRVSYSLFGVERPDSGVGLTWPEGYYDTILPSLIEDDRVTFDEVRRFLDITPAEFAEARRRLTAGSDGQRDPVAHFIRILAATRNYHGIALRLLADGQADFTAVYYQGIDEVCHRFIHFTPPRMEGIAADDMRRFGQAVERFYEYQDALLGELLAAADPATVVLIVSDHGFVNGPDRIPGRTADIEGQPARWHRRHGIFVAAGQPIRPVPLDTISLLDVAPTILALAGLPVPHSMAGRVLHAAIDPRFLEEYPERRVPDNDLPPMRAQSASAQTAASGDAFEPGRDEMMATLRSLGYVGSGPSTSPGTLTSHVNLAGIHLAAGDLDLAAAEVAAAMRLAPNSRQARTLLFELRIRQRRFDEALSAGESLLDEGVEELGDVFPARLAAAYREAGRLEEGVARLERGVALGRWRLGSALARLQHEAGRTEAATKAALAVLVRDPLDEAAMAVLVHGARERGSTAPLSPILEEALRSNPRSVMHLNWMSLPALERGDAARAGELLEAALDVNPDHPVTLANLGALHIRSGRPDLALPILVRAVDLNPASIEARVNLGSTWARLGRYREAIGQFEAAWGLGHHEPEIARALARAWSEAGDSQAARRWMALAAPESD